MKARHAVVGALLLAPGVAVWWALPELNAPTAFARDVSASGADRATATTTTIAANDAARSGEVPRDAASTEDSSQSLHARIQVVDAAGEPVAGATVRYLPAHRGELYLTATDEESMLVTAGSSAITDANGCVEVDADPETMVCARHGDDYGTSHLPQTASYLLQNVRPTAQDVRLQLKRDVALRVELVDTAGRPVTGESVCVEVEYISRSRGLAHRCESLTLTDEAGVTILPHALHALQIEASVLRGELRLVKYRRDSDSEPTVLAEQRIPIAALQPRTDVRLTVPAGGTIVVSATDADGGPLSRSVWLIDDRSEVFDQAPHVRGTEQVFRNVPCGRQWRVEASDRGIVVGAPDNVVKRFVGPRTDDEVVAVAVQVPVRVWQLRLKVVRSDGRPLEAGDVGVRCTRLDCNDVGGMVDGRGDVHGLVFRGTAHVADLAPLELRIESPFCVPRSFVFERPIRAGATDLGEVVVEPPAGETLLARVELRGGGRTLTDGYVGLISDDGQKLEELPTLSHVVDGVFELRGVPRAGRMLASCNHPRFAPQRPVAVRLGEHRIVELQPAATLCVAVEATGLPIGPIVATLVRLDGEPAESSCQVDETSHASLWVQLAPGHYRLRIAYGERVVHQVDDLELRPGENRWPADGTRFDLRDRVRVVMIATTPMSLLDGPELFAIERGATSLPDDFHANLTYGQSVLAPAAGAFDVLVRCHDYVPRRLVNPGAYVELPMQECTWIALEAAVACESVRVHIVSDAVTDPLLRAFDCHQHASDFQANSDDRLPFAPGTVLDLTAVRNGKPGAPQRVVVGTESPQVVALR